MVVYGPWVQPEARWATPRSYERGRFFTLTTTPTEPPTEWYEFCDPSTPRPRADFAPALYTDGGRLSGGDGVALVYDLTRSTSKVLTHNLSLHTVNWTTEQHYFESTLPDGATDVEYDGQGVWSGQARLRLVLSVGGRGLGENRPAGARLAQLPYHLPGVAVQDLVSTELPSPASMAEWPVLITAFDAVTNDTAAPEDITYDEATLILDVPTDDRFSFAALLDAFLDPHSGNMDHGWPEGEPGWFYEIATWVRANVTRTYTPPRWRAVYDRAPYTIRAGSGSGAGVFYEGGRYGL